MKFYKNISLKTKMLGTVTVAVVLVAAGGLGAILTLEGAYKETIEKSLVDNARDLGVKIATQFYERYGDVQAFAVNETIKKLDSHAMPALLDQYVSLYGIYDLILVVDKTGRPVASNLKDTSGKAIDIKALRDLDYSSAPWFKAVMAGETTDDKDKGYSGTYVEDFIADPLIKVALGETRYGSSFSAPIKNDAGETIGVVTNRANSKWFETDLKVFYQFLKDQGTPTAQFMILNRSGLVIDDYDPNESQGNLEVTHDSKSVLKANMVKAGFGPAVYASKSEDGFLVSHDVRNPKLTQIYGIHHVDNFKWPKALGWTIFVSAEESDAYSEISRVSLAFYGSLGVCLLIAVLLGLYVASAISKSIASVTQTMAGNAEEVQGASKTIADSAVQLSESAHEQAAALQETVAAVDEISAMVEKNAEAANRSKEVSGQSREAAERGRSIVDTMIQAISDIDSANEDISNQMQTSNRELGEITNLINDIGSKTKIINEIVFQTKLLSFNASVEAARAGEYGKGFAVVAEEVGNLAEMSGSAAKEISTLLETSVRKVEAIVDQTKSRVERLTTLAKEKVKTGGEVAKECNSALEEILSNVQSVDSLVSEIAVASTEQSTGIREISKAVGQMEQVTQQNSVVAQNSSTAATQLSSQSTQLNSLVQDLREVVTGHRNESHHEAVKIPQKSSTVVKFERKAEKPKTLQVESPAEPVVETKVASSDVVPSSHDPGFEE